MSLQTISTTSPRNRQEWVYLLLPATPLLLLAGLMLYGVAKESQARSDLRVELQRLEQEGRPVSNHGVTVAYDRRTDRKNSERWHDVFRATAELDNRFWALEHAVETVPFGSDIEPDPRATVPIELQHADEALPVIELIEQLVDDAVPFWSPLVFDGYQTSFEDIQWMRSPFRLLAAEFRAAVEQGEHERALRALGLMLGVADAFDTETAVVSELVRNALLGGHRTQIQESLAIGFWTEPDHLRQLREQLRRRDNLDRRWQRMLEAEWSMMASQFIGAEADDLGLGSWYGMPANLIPFGIPASAELSLIRNESNFPVVPGVGTNQHVRSIRRIEEKLEETAPIRVERSLVSIPLANVGFLWDLIRPASGAYALSFASIEFDRKIALTGVAVKQFQVQEGRWPTELSELSGVGLTAGDWSVQPSVPIGYQVSDDETEALLWAGRGGGYDPIFVSSQPEHPQDANLNHVWNVPIR